MKADKVVEALGALAHEHRLKVFRMLVQVGSEGLAAGVIAEQLRMAPSTLTFHTQALLRAGLLSQRRMGRQVMYSVDFKTMNGVVGYLMENCCGGAAVAPVCNPCAPAVEPEPGNPRRRSA
jgi:DNA-binding transcriptional ArsR family regulator